eukprot:14593-Pyramimonas_sp.AAC.1
MAGGRMSWIEADGTTRCYANRRFSGDGGCRAARQRRGCAGYGGADNARWQQFLARRSWVASAMSKYWNVEGHAGHLHPGPRRCQRLLGAGGGQRGRSQRAPAEAIRHLNVQEGRKMLGSLDWSGPQYPTPPRRGLGYNATWNIGGSRCGGSVLA